MLRKRIPPVAAARRRFRRGFTLVEMLVSMIVIVQVLLIALLMFDFNSRVTRVQTRVAEMQQSLRVGQQELVRMTRLAGRSGLPVTSVQGTIAAPEYPAARLAVEVLNNVTGDDRKVVPELDDSPLAMEGSDILVLRGNFSTPLYNVRLLSLDPGRDETETGTLSIQRVSASHPEQDLGPLMEIDDQDRGIPEALILFPTTPSVAYSVLELIPNGTGNSADEVILDFRVKGSGTDIADLYQKMWTNDAENVTFPMAPGSPGYLGILEEYRFYVRNDGGPTADQARPRLSRARLLPGTGLPHGDPAEDPPELSLRTDIADNILDLQVSLGFDTDLDGAVIGEEGIGTIFESETGTADDWLFNHPDDDPDSAPFLVTEPNDVPPLYYVRVTALARTGAGDRQDREKPLLQLEDHVYAEDSGLVNSEIARKYRRRFLRTTVDLRNL